VPAAKVDEPGAAEAGGYRLVFRDRAFLRLWAFGATGLAWTVVLAGAQASSPAEATAVFTLAMAVLGIGETVLSPSAPALANDLAPDGLGRPVQRRRRRPRRPAGPGAGARMTATDEARAPEALADRAALAGRCRAAVTGARSRSSSASSSPNDPELATLFHNLGGLAHARGDFAAAQEPARRSVDLRRRALADDHLAVAADAAALAAILDALGRDEEAEQLLRDAIACFERAFGPTHYEVAFNRGGSTAGRSPSSTGASSRITPS
jgi:tetratricopeptide (TPR) repeat protein